MNSGLFGAWRRGERRPAALGKLRAGAQGCPSPIYHLPAKPYPCETRDFKKQLRAGKICPFFPAPAQPLTRRQPLDAACTGRRGSSVREGSWRTHGSTAEPGGAAARGAA